MLWLLKLGITMLIHNKDDIEFVTEFPWFLGHPVDCSLILLMSKLNCKSEAMQQWMMKITMAGKNTSKPYCWYLSYPYSNKDFWKFFQIQNQKKNQIHCTSHENLHRC